MFKKYITYSKNGKPYTFIWFSKNTNDSKNDRYIKYNQSNKWVCIGLIDVDNFISNPTQMNLLGYLNMEVLTNDLKIEEQSTMFFDLSSINKFKVSEEMIFDYLGTNKNEIRGYVFTRKSMDLIMGEFI